MREKSKLSKELEKRGLTSYANTTRWSLFLPEIANLCLDSRVKWIFDKPPSEWGAWIIPVDHCIEHLRLGPIPFSEIEWLEINLIKEIRRGELISPEMVDYSKEVSCALSNSKLVSELNENCIKVWGYR